MKKIFTILALCAFMSTGAVEVVKAQTSTEIASNDDKKSKRQKRKEAQAAQEAAAKAPAGKACCAKKEASAKACAGEGTAKMEGKACHMKAEAKAADKGEAKLEAAPATQE